MQFEFVVDFDKNHEDELFFACPVWAVGNRPQPVGAFCKTPGNRLSALVEPFGAHGGRFAKIVQGECN